MKSTFAFGIKCQFCKCFKQHLHKQYLTLTFINKTIFNLGEVGYLFDDLLPRTISYFVKAVLVNVPANYNTQYGLMIIRSMDLSCWKIVHRSVSIKLSPLVTFSGNSAWNVTFLLSKAMAQAFLMTSILHQINRLVFCIVCTIQVAVYGRLRNLFRFHGKYNFNIPKYVL